MKNKPAIFYFNLFIMVTFMMYVISNIVGQFKDYQPTWLDAILAVGVFALFGFARRMKAPKYERPKLTLKGVAGPIKSMTSMVTGTFGRRDEEQNEKNKNGSEKGDA